jgi:regulatory protein
MIRKFFIGFFLSLTLVANANNRSAELARLDSVLARQPYYLKVREQHIEQLKIQLQHEQRVQQRLRLYNELYQNYYVFQFDSAMKYINESIEYAVKTGQTSYYAQNIIQKADLLSIGGLYSQALESLSLLKPSVLPDTLKFNYYLTLFHTYVYWADYCSDAIYAPRYREMGRQNLVSAMPFLDKRDKRYSYYMGEYSGYILNDPLKARKYYQQSIATTPESTRMYAMACFALACNYNAAGDTDNYENYLLMACESDAKSLTMENMALQNLAMYTLEHGEGTLAIEDAQRYINISLNNAKFYNSRLRIIEVSNRLPIIVNSYQRQLQQTNSFFRNSLLVISVFAVFLFISIGFIFKQNNRLTHSRRKLQESNHRLSEMNERQSLLNEQLYELNEKLVVTNKKREGLVKLYIDLCSRFINRLKKQQTLVKRKIKANQAQELLTQLSSDRLSEEDAATFLLRFDKAFLDLYPTFPAELNALLRPEDQILQPDKLTMTTEQRIMALVRLGVTESSEIANLLFYSPQTIYNYRSAMRAKALDKNNFEKLVAQLCTVIHD